MKIKNSLIIILYLILQINPVLAYNLRQISNKDGLSNSAVLSLCQDKKGFLWIGTCDGLNLFDGKSIQVLKPNSLQGDLSGNLIENITEQDDGIFWIQTNYGLNRYDRNTETVDRYNEFKGNYILRKNNQTVFILQGDNQLFYFHEKSKTFKKIYLDGLDFKNVLNFILTDNTIWIFSKQNKSKIYSIEPMADGDFRCKVNLSSVLISSSLQYCFKEDANDTIVYFINEKGHLLEYNLKRNEQKFVIDLKSEIEKKGEISSIVKYENDYFIGFKTNGLVRLGNIDKVSNRYSVEELDVKSGIFCLLKDKYQDIVWIGTDGQGVYMYSKEPYSIRAIVLDRDIYNIKKPIRSLFLDKENTLWIGTKGDGILKVFDYNRDKSVLNHKLEHITASNSNLVDNQVYVMSRSSKNILWIGTEAGLNYYSYAENQLKQISLDKGDLKYIHSITETDDSTLWLATVGTGIVRAKIKWVNNNPTLYDIRRFTINGDGFSYNYFFTSYKENNGRMWFGNRGYGAFSMDADSGKLIPLSFENVKNSNQTLNDVFSITKDRDGVFWFGTSSGLIRYSPNQEIKVYDERDGLPNNTIHSILIDSHNNLWLSTNQGLVKFNTKKETFEIYNHRKGLLVTEYSDGASFKSDDSKILMFGGINGFTSVVETGFEQRIYFPPIIFNFLNILGEDYAINKLINTEKYNGLIELNHDQNFFTISFSAIDYLNGNNYTYKYKLDGMSNQWFENGSQNSISFTDVSPGEYTLYIQYTNNAIGQDSPVYSIKIIIHPPWYRSTIAYIVYFLLLSTFIFLFVRSLVIRNLRKRNRMLEKLKIQEQEKVHESKLQFFTNIAHEFCTPLTLISGPCSRILTHKGTDLFVRGYASIIQKNADRLNDLIKDLIEFRRIETENRPKQIEEVAVSELVETILNSLRDFTKSKNIILDASIQPDVTWNTDKGFLYTIIFNLLSSSIKYTERDDTIEIDIRESLGYLVIKISNIGKGVEKQELDHIFNKYRILSDFENSDKNTRNELGLAIANSLVGLLDGNIEIETIDDKNYTIVSLPPDEIKETSQINTELPELKLPELESSVVLPHYEIDNSRQTILIIDEDIDVLWLICEIFIEDFNVIPINEAVSSNSLLSEFYPDLIICDITHSFNDGISFTKELKANKATSHIPIILISAKQTVEEQIQGLAAGAERYIAKPFNVDYLKVSVDQLILRKDVLKDYFNSPLSAYDLIDGKLSHKENQKFMKKVYSVIDKNITSNKLSANFIADELGISMRHLYRKIKDAGEHSITEIIREGRLHMAEKLLQTSKLSIDEIIYKVGFSNRSTFYKVFSEKHNCTPKEYRENSKPS